MFHAKHNRLILRSAKQDAFASELCPSPKGTTCKLLIGPEAISQALHLRRSSLTSHNFALYSDFWLEELAVTHLLEKSQIIWQDERQGKMGQ